MSLLWAIVAVAFVTHAMPAQVALSVVRWNVADAGCHAILVNGVKVKTITVPHPSGGSFEVGAGLVDRDGQFQVLVGLSNKSAARLDLVPEATSLEIELPKQKPLSRIDPRQLISRSGRSSKARAAIVGGLGGWQEASGRQRTGTVWVDGRPVNVSVYERTNPEAKQQADRTVDRIWSRQREREQAILNTFLFGTTVMPGEDAGGIVAFQREKRREKLVFSIAVEKQAFEFDFFLPAKEVVGR